MASDLKTHQARTTYLITYSQADLEKIPTRKDFAQLVVDGFNQGRKVNRVIQWACSKEKHTDEGCHYHLVLDIT